MNPKPGAVVEYRGQAYTLLRAEPYERKRDGVLIELLCWRSKCPQCNGDFECTTSAAAPSFKPARRCPDCRPKSRWTRRMEPRPPVQWPLREFPPVEVYEDRIR
jgi:hypothetical protein